jgi:acetyl esterase/lipase
LFKII